MKNIRKHFSSLNKKKLNSSFMRPFEFNIDKMVKLSNAIDDSNNHLYSILIEQIKKNGPMSISDYMSQCLFHNEYGYYSTKNFIFGDKGDFITSPEISPVFGEMLTLWIFKQLEAFEFPKEIDLVEIGPGRGFLAIDISRSLNNIKPQQRLNYFLIEKSKKLTKIQQEGLMSSLVKNKLKPSLKMLKPNTISGSIVNNLKESIDIIEATNFNFIWVSSIEEYLNMINKSKLADIKLDKFNSISSFSHIISKNQKFNPLLVIANEFFDALPISKIIYKNGKWREVQIGLVNDNLAFTVSEEETEIITKFILPEMTFHGLQVSENDQYEYSIQSVKYMALICMLMTQRKQSSSLIIDYGELHAFKDSLRGIKEQKLIPSEELLKLSGKCDLSAYVNFALLKRVCSLFPSLQYNGLLKQGDFLEFFGISNRMNILLEQAKNKKEEDNLFWQHQKLTSSDQMGDNFKVMNIKKTDNPEVFPFIKEILDKI